MDLTWIKPWFSRGNFKKLFNKKKLAKFFSSKLIVSVSLLLLIFGAFGNFNKANADEDTDISMAYQYFLLQDTKIDIAKKDNKSVLASAASIFGSGGASGDFYYTDIIQGAKDNGQESAKRFSSMMATLAGYNYITVKSHAPIQIVVTILRGIIGAIITPFALITDIFNNTFAQLLKFFATFNVFTLFGGSIANSSLGDTMRKALGITTEQLQKVIEIGLSSLSVVLLGTFIMMLRNGGSNIDRRAQSKLMGRVISIGLLPVAMAGGAVLLEEVADVTGALSTDAVYSQYLLDTRSWAFNNNFDMSVGGANEVRTGKNGNFVDTEYNPYIAGNNKALKISEALWNKSELNNGGNSKKLFVNSALALSYMTGEDFTARDYLGYVKSSRTAVGSIPNIIDKYKSDLYDFDTPTTSTGKDKKNEWDGQESPMSAAKKDYYSEEFFSDKKQPLKSKINTWTDRYIYGAKNSGNIKKYYNKRPSKEQVYSGAGSGDPNVFSDESMFYILNTRFTDSGGYFSIDGPARGAYASIAKYDSNRVSYYRVSMLGTPFFTIAGLLTKPIATFIVTMAAIVAFWTMGILDMNLRPLRAWFKACFKGDIEYLKATLAYALGLVATILNMTFMPNLLINLFQGALAYIAQILTGQVKFENVSSALDSEMIGFSLWISFVFAVAGAWMFLRDPKFRNKLIEAISIPWYWAVSVGQKFEDEADGKVSGNHIEKGKGMVSARQKRREEQMDNVQERLLHSSDTALGRGLNKLTGNGITKMGAGMAQARTMSNILSGKMKTDETGTGYGKKMDEIKREGMAGRMSGNLRKMAQKMDSKELEKSLGTRLEGNQLATALSDDNLYNPDSTFKTDVDDLPQEDKDIRQDLNNQFDDLRKDQEQLTENKRQIDKALENPNLSPKEKEKLQAEKDNNSKKQEELNKRRQELMKKNKAYIDNVKERREKSLDPKRKLKNLKRLSLYAGQAFQDYHKQPNIENAQKLREALSLIKQQSEDMSYTDSKDLVGFDIDEAIKDLDENGFETTRDRQELTVNGDGDVDYYQKFSDRIHHVSGKNIDPDLQDYIKKDNNQNTVSPLDQNLADLANKEAPLPTHEFSTNEFNKLYTKAVDKNLSPQEMNNAQQELKHYVDTLTSDGKKAYTQAGFDKKFNETAKIKEDRWLEDYLRANNQSSGSNIAKDTIKQQNDSVQNRTITDGNSGITSFSSNVGNGNASMTDYKREPSSIVGNGNTSMTDYKREPSSNVGNGNASMTDYKREPSSNVGSGNASMTDYKREPSSNLSNLNSSLQNRDRKLTNKTSSSDLSRTYNEDFQNALRKLDEKNSLDGYRKK